MEDRGIVYVIDDDPSMRSLIETTVRASGAETKTFASAREFAGYALPERVSCVILDLEMPGVSGMELLETHFHGKIEHPVIILTAHGSVPAAVKSLKLGAVDFLEKPFERPVLVKVINAALEGDRVRLVNVTARDVVRRKLESLSPRETELLGAVIEGKSTKMIADELGISARTVDHHRANLMAKMQAANVADLVRMAVETGYTSKPGISASTPG